MNMMMIGSPNVVIKGQHRQAATGKSGLRASAFTGHRSALASSVTLQLNNDRYVMLFTVTCIVLACVQRKCIEEMQEGNPRRSLSRHTSLVDCFSFFESL